MCLCYKLILENAKVLSKGKTTKYSTSQTSGTELFGRVYVSPRDQAHSHQFQIFSGHRVWSVQGHVAMDFTIHYLSQK